MNVTRLTFALVIASSVSACSGAQAPLTPTPSSSASPTASPTPTLPPVVVHTSPPPSESPPDHGPLGFISDLLALDVDAREDSTFDGEPISRQGLAVCVEGEVVQVYIFGTPQEAQTAASHIDPRDPSNVGTAIIDWAGEPKFWLRDRIIVLYLGQDEEVQTALVSVLGDPFARGLGAAPPLGGEC